ncbi:MAG: hypothetical protein A3G20_07775 [Acidobacteria bacterium RIFCSPLOWO2_12_FULL_59_11]|nr:MAG: hypothetical protein A3G20_07775 [Acidobacteria bacterium RIFCSPLOWO2_12_FULL_59_11]
MLRVFLLVSWILYTMASPATSFAGEIQGRVSIIQGLTKERVVLPTYQVRGMSVPAKQEEKTSIDEFSRVAVYLELAAKAPAPEASKATLAQRNQRFEPELLIVPVGTTVSFPNSDPIFHNIFSLSKAKQFDLGYYPAGETRTVKFEKAGIVQVYCHIHTDMNAAIVVAPSAWHAQPGPDGKFVLRDVPGGTQEVVVWHKAAGFIRKKIQVPESGSVEVSFDVPVLEKEGVR